MNGNLISKMDKLEEQILEKIKKIKKVSKRPETGSIFKLLTKDAVTNERY